MAKQVLVAVLLASIVPWAHSRDSEGTAPATAHTGGEHGAARVASGTAPMNVLMIAVDDLRPDIAGLYGQSDVSTPNLDRLQRMGTTFTRAYCQLSLCSPSRTSLLTGQRPDNTRVWEIGPYFRTTQGPSTGNRTVTLPQHFKRNGYNSTGGGKVFHAGTSSGGPTRDEGGFDDPYSWSQPYWGCDQFYNGTVQSLRAQGWPNSVGCVQTPACHECMKAHGSEGGPSFKPSWVGAPCPASCYPDGLVAEHVSQLLHERATAASGASGTPFFVAAGFKRPHLGWFAPQQYFDMYDNATMQLAKHRTPPEGMPPPAWNGNLEISGMQDVRPLMQPTSVSPGFNVSLVPDWKQHELRRAYYAAVSFMDSQLGVVLDAFDALPESVRNNTAIALWGDHGYQLGEHGEWAKQTAFELGARVPLIISLPGQPDSTRGTASDALVELVDLYPTLVDAAGLPAPASPLDGSSLVDVIMGRTRGGAKNASFTQQLRNAGRWDGPTAMGCSIRVDEWRYTQWLNWSAPVQPGDPGTIKWSEVLGEELYDHRGDKEGDFDAFENVNVADDPRYASIRAQLQQELRSRWT